MGRLEKGKGVCSSLTRDPCWLKVDGSDFSSNFATTRLAREHTHFAARDAFTTACPPTLPDMARATRSTTAHEKEKPAEAPPLARKAASKKRKRPSAAGDPSDQPASKLARTDDAVKEEDVQDMEEIPAEEAKPELPSSGDVPLQPEDAEKILEVLEMYA